MEENFSLLKSDEIVHVEDRNSPVRRFISTETFKVKALVERIESSLIESLTQGFECEVMQLENPGWQKGIVRIKKIELEFCPAPEEDDPVESPLDALRGSVI